MGTLYPAIYFHIRYVAYPKEYVVDVYEEKPGTTKVLCRTPKKELAIAMYIAATDNIAIKNSFDFIAAETRDRVRIHTYELRQGIKIYEIPDIEK